jgi:hypothetical protein
MPSMSSSSFDPLAEPPRYVQLQVQSTPQGAEARTSIGQALHHAMRDHPDQSGNRFPGQLRAERIPADDDSGADHPYPLKLLELGTDNGQSESGICATPAGSAAAEAGPQEA